MKYSAQRLLAWKTIGILYDIFNNNFGYQDALNTLKCLRHQLAVVLYSRVTHLHSLADTALFRVASDSFVIETAVDSEPLPYTY